MKKTTILFIIFIFIAGILLVLSSKSNAANINVEQVRLDSQGASIRISSDVRIRSLEMYIQNNSGKYIRFYNASNVNSTEKVYFISQWRLSQDVETLIKIVVGLDNGDEQNVEIKIGKVPQNNFNNSQNGNTSDNNSNNSQNGNSSQNNSNSNQSGNNSQNNSSTSNSSNNGQNGNSSQSNSNSNNQERSISLNKTSLTLDLTNNKKERLTAEVTSSNSSANLIWSTSNSKVAKVDSNGNVTAVGTGTATVTVKANNNLSAKCSVTVRANSEAIEILFVGNSKTFMNYIPRKVQALAKSAGYTVNVTSATIAAKSLDYISENKKNIIQEKAYDYVIMQERTDTYLNEYNTFLNGANNVKKLVRSKNPNAELFVRQTWVRKNSSSSDKKKAYNNAVMVAEKIGAKLIYDGRAFDRCMTRYQNIILFELNDNVHQSESGAYLSACAIYRAVFDKSPVGLNYKASLTKTNAKKLQSIANYVYNANN